MEISKLFCVSGLTVVITGGAKGIGLMLSEAYVKNGSTVYISSRSKDACDATAKELTSKGPGVCYSVPFDLSTVKACEDLAKTLVEKHNLKKIDVLVNNSGVSWGEPLETYSEKGWDKVMNLNVKSLFYVTRALLPLLENAATKERPARVINIGSIAGIRSQMAPTYAYDISKAAVHSLTQKLANDFAYKNITVNAIAPGYVPTKMSKGLLTYTSKEDIDSNIPMGRGGTPEDMAGAALYLSSRASAWVTGVILTVDGGFVINVKPPSKINASL